MFTREEPTRSIRLKSPVIPVLVLILLGVQLFFPFRGWVILLSGFGGMWLVSYIWARGLRRGLRINRDMSFGWKQVGDRLRERVLLENNSWVPSLWVHVDDHSDMRDYEISAVTDVRGWRYRNWHTQGVCNHRGLFTLGPVTLRAEDPFGIYEVLIDYTESVNMMVVPPVVTLPEIEIASGGRVGEGRSSNKGLKQTVSAVGLREYVPGDSLRWLHWPTIARKGELYVHLFENEPTSDWWVLLDMDETVQVGSGQRSTEEHAIMLAASLVNRGIQLGKHVGLIAQGKGLAWHNPDLGDSHLWSVLRSLATIRPGVVSLEQILAKIKTDLGRNSSLVVITPNLSPGWISALELLRRMGIIPTVLLLDPISFGGDGSLEVIRTRLRKMEIAHHVITSDLLDRPQKQVKKAWEWLTSTQPMGEILDDWEIRWRKVRRFLRTWGLIAVFYYVLANMLDGAIRGLEIDLIRSMLVGGLIVGALLSVSRLKGWFVGITSAITGLLVALLRVGGLGDELGDLLVRSFRISPEIFSWVFKSADKPDFLPISIRLGEIWLGITNLSTRLWQWARTVIGGQYFYDPVAITFLWSISVWVVVIWSMWGIWRKRNPLSGMIPGIALGSITIAVVGKTAYDLVFLVGAMMVLMTLMKHDIRELAWQFQKLNVTSSIRRNVLIASMILTVMLMVFSLVTPSISIESITDFVRELTGERVDETDAIARSLGLEKQGDAEMDVLNIAMAGGLPNEHLIGSGPELSEEIVMVVSIESPQGVTVEPPIYLQSLVYDLYTGKGWESRGTEINVYEPGATLVTNKPKNAFRVRQQVQYVADTNGFLYTLGLPISADHRFKVAWRVVDNQNALYDILGSTIEGDAYRADSYIQRHSVEELRSVGQVYPQWIIDRYLSLPSSVPESVLSLAVELTATEITPYDRVVAIEQYLRKIPYSLNVSTGPAGVDIVDYFLFSLERGYCDYYASAMVVLARAAGIPARYVVGYIAEDFDETEGVYVVTADQAHAWPEILFPGYGWVPFEPTGGRPAMGRPPEPFPELPSEFDLEFSPLVPENPFTFSRFITIFWFSIAGFLVLGLVFWRVNDRWLQRQPVEVLIPKLYRRIYRYARWSGLRVQPGVTANAFSGMLRQYLTQMSNECLWSDWMLSAVPLIGYMTETLVRHLFDPQEIDKSAGAYFENYCDLRLRLWVLWLLGKAYRYRILRSILWINAPLIISMSSEETP